VDLYLEHARGFRLVEGRVLGALFEEAVELRIDRQFGLGVSRELLGGFWRIRTSSNSVSVGLALSFLLSTTAFLNSAVCGAMIGDRGVVVG